jgi:transcriptional regulator with XRE-family HTH domain
MSANPSIRFEDWEAEQMQDPEFRDAVERLEPAYQVTRLRVKRGLTQQQLARLVGTHQSSIARLESGRIEPRLSFLRRVIEALGGRLEVRVVPQEEPKIPETRRPSIVVASQADTVEPILVPNWPLPKECIVIGHHATDTADASSTEVIAP